METPAALASRISRLERTLRRDRAIGFALLVLLLGAAASARRQQAPSSQTTFEELSAQRINVVDADGRRCIVLASAARMPLPVLRGKEWPRSIQPAGIVFYKADGDECGGVALAEVGGARKSMLLFDYSNSEAVGIGMLESPDGYSAGLTVVERMPLDADVGRVGTSGPERASLSNESGSAQLRLCDARGRPRIRISVEPTGEGGIELLDEAGEVLERWP